MPLKDLEAPCKLAECDRCQDTLLEDIEIHLPDDQHIKHSLAQYRWTLNDDGTVLCDDCADFSDDEENESDA